MKRFIQLSLFIFLGFFLTGCSLKYDLHPSISSTAEYEEDLEKQKVVYLKDNRQDKVFIKGIGGLQSIDIKIGNIEDPINWLAQSLEKEFASHKISIKFSTDQKLEVSADAILTVNKYQIINSRTSSYHPFVAYHSFSGTINSSTSNQAIISYFVYGKTPIWSMDEVQEPCFDMPSAILIKGIAAKVNRLALHYRMNDEELDELNKETQSKVDALSPNAYLSVLDLGESNNPKAINYLKPYTGNSDLIIRASALSAIGMIGREDSLQFLKEQYDKLIDIDRFMALKSIGDLDTPEAMQIFKDARMDPQYNEENGFKFLVDLYLDSIQ